LWPNLIRLNSLASTPLALAHALDRVNNVLRTQPVGTNRANASPAQSDKISVQVEWLSLDSGVKTLNATRNLQMNRMADTRRT
jgi:hypothetical protein